MMANDIASETQEMHSRTICGHVDVPDAQGGRLLRAGSCLVALKMENVVASMERTMRLQLKLTPRSIIFAIRTLVFTFYRNETCQTW
jgi:hypothetical protein